MSISISSSTGGHAPAVGSPAQVAYDRAVKALVRAQQKLAQDGVSGAGEDQVKADQLAVELAQVAVEQAAARLAQEQKSADPTVVQRERVGTVRVPEGALDVLA